MHSSKVEFLTAASIGAVIAITTCSVAAGPSAVKPGDVNEARVLSEAATGNNWLVTGRDFGSQHFSPLKQITDGNIGKLGLAWSLDIDSPMGLANEPIVVDGTIYISASLDRVYAVDAVSGTLLWKFDPHVRLNVMRNSWAARTNRGVAV